MCVCVCVCVPLSACAHLKEQLAVVLQSDTLSIRQCEQFVVIHYTVHVLHPHSVYITVKDKVPVDTHTHTHTPRACMEKHGLTSRVRARHGSQTGCLL